MNDWPPSNRRWIKLDREMIFKSWPPCGDVTLWHGEGMYLRDNGDIKLIIVVGPMKYAPMDIAENFGDFQVTKLEVLPGDCEASKNQALARGFFAMKIVRRELVDEAPKISTAA